MIPLDRTPLLTIGPDYCNKMRSGIIDRYNIAKGGMPIEINPFTNTDFTLLWEDAVSGLLDHQLVDSLLSSPMDTVCSFYPQIDFYMKTCKLVFFGSLHIDDELKKAGMPITKPNRENHRRDFLILYDNPWIAEHKDRHPRFFQNNTLFRNFILDVKRDMTSLNQAISIIVDYNKFMDADYRHEILSRIGKEVCPYCNRQYITQYDEVAVTKTTADLDHFHPNSAFKLFSLSLFNFVPSCQICNSRFKLAKCYDIVYPYDRGFDDSAWFKVQMNEKSTVDTITGNNINFDLDLEFDPSSSHSVKIQNSMELFKLAKVYQSHKEYVRELLYKKHAYAGTYQDEMQKLFTTMNLSEEQINLFLYGDKLLPDNLSMRPLAKLAYDVIKKA
ncbi:HNH endonuclease [Paenibacillus agricola]|uniref:HNH endonuclease n=1 Tax=Paenibacillus agricola TaxID=2716264 RepID=A0ABX0JET3_9BACL|nr:HNH endonuclease [Paenibacillus agricola]NHN33208.1 HNH endonuclease [Paenibacillus agricola]